MSEREGVLSRVVAQIRALLPKDWRGRAGQRFRKAAAVISEFTEENHIRPRELAEGAVSLTRRKVEGLANKEYATAAKEFAEAEDKKIDIVLKRRSLESEVRKKEAEARKAEIDNVITELTLLQKLKEAGVVLARDEKGNLTVLRAPIQFPFEDLKRRLLEAGKDSDPKDPKSSEPG